MGEPRELLRLLKDFDNRHYLRSLEPIADLLKKDPKSLSTLELQETYKSGNTRLFDFLVSVTIKQSLQDYDFTPTIVDVVMAAGDYKTAAYLLVNDFKLTIAPREYLKPLLAEIARINAKVGLHGRIHVPEIPEYYRRYIKSTKTPFKIDLTVEKESPLGAACLLPIYNSGLRTWVTEQVAYINSSPRLKYIVRSYTRRGDRIANGYLRGTLKLLVPLLDAIATDRNVPFAYQIVDMYAFLKSKKLVLPEEASLKNKGEVVHEAVQDLFVKNKARFLDESVLGPIAKAYCRDLLHIIQQAPKPPTDLYVYRGIRNEAFLAKGTLSYVETSFQSTSINPYSAASLAYTTTYLRTPYKFCILEIKIPRGIPCIYLESVTEFEGEYEVLLPYNLKMALKPDIYLKYEPNKDGLLEYGKDYFDDLEISRLPQVLVRTAAVMKASGYEEAVVARGVTKTKKWKKGNYIKVNTRKSSMK